MPFANIQEMPKLGFGLWKIPEAEAASVVYEAIKVGYRHFDSACDYGNERSVGAGIQRALNEGLCERSDLWITSKLWNTYHHPDRIEQALERTLTDLGLEYLDLYLIHFPIALAFVPFETRYPPEWTFDPEAVMPVMVPEKVTLADTWRGMEQLKSKGNARHIGVANYNSGLLHDLMNYAEYAPEVLQIESHPYLTQDRLVAMATQYGISVTAFSPLGASSYVELDMAVPEESLLEDPVMLTIADRHHATPAQIALAWGLHRGTSLVVKSVDSLRMQENLGAVDIRLSDIELSEISGLNRGRRYNDPGQFCEQAFNTLYPIYD